MPRYRLNIRSFINGSIHERGEVIEYDGIPGSNLEPVDDGAKAAREAADADRNRRAGLRSADGKRPLEKLPPQEKPDLVEIPETWRDLPAEQRINLARRLGAPVKGTKAKQADEMIETELARRATV
jgi:hypothetical protein